MERDVDNIQRRGQGGQNSGQGGFGGGQNGGQGGFGGGQNGGQGGFGGGQGGFGGGGRETTNNNQGNYWCNSWKSLDIIIFGFQKLVLRGF